MELVIDTAGQVRCLYSEELNLAALGDVQIERGSYVEPDVHGRWTVDLSPLSGPQLGPFLVRSTALSAEVAWLRAHWLLPPP